MPELQKIMHYMHIPNSWDAVQVWLSSHVGIPFDLAQVHCRGWGNI